MRENARRRARLKAESVSRDKKRGLERVPQAPRIARKKTPPNETDGVFNTRACTASRPHPIIFRLSRTEAFQESAGGPPWNKEPAFSWTPEASKQ